MEKKGFYFTQWDISKFQEITDQVLSDGFSYSNKKDAMEVGNDGYKITQMAFNALDTDSENERYLGLFSSLRNDYPNSIEGTTGWYIPSINEITRALAGLVGFDADNLDDSSEGGCTIEGLGTTIDKYFNAAGGNVSHTSSSYNEAFVTTTPYSNGQMFGIDLGDNYLQYLFRGADQLPYYWPILAF